MVGVYLTTWPAAATSGAAATSAAAAAAADADADGEAIQRIENNRKA